MLLKRPLIGAVIALLFAGQAFAFPDSVPSDSGNAVPVQAVSVMGVTVNPSSVLTRPSDTTAYAQNDLIASSTTAGSVVVPSFTAARYAAGSGLLIRGRLYTNKTSGWDGVTVRVRIWTTAPTYSAGDNAAYAVATGSAGLVGQMDVTLSQFSDGAMGFAAPSVGTAIGFKLASGQTLFWDLQMTNSGGATPASGQTFTFVPEIIQD